MENSELKDILKQHKVWLETNGAKGIRANLEGANLSHAILQGANLWRAKLKGTDLSLANLYGAILEDTNLQGTNLQRTNLLGTNLTDADLTDANLTGADLTGAYLRQTNLKDARGLPDISWIKSGCLVKLNHLRYELYLENEGKHENFIQDALGMILQENLEEKTFDILVEDRIIRGIPEWVKYSGIKNQLKKSYVE